jgi:hypothetical protein
MILNKTTPSFEPKLSADKGGEFGSASLPAASVARLREKFDEMSVQVSYEGKLVDVAVMSTLGTGSCRLNDMKWNDLTWEELGEEIGAELATADLSLEVVEYLLHKELCYLLAQKAVGAITEEETKLLELHREKWQEEPWHGDQTIEAYAREAGVISDREAALLDVYRTTWVTDTVAGRGFCVIGARVYDLSFSYWFCSRWDRLHHIGGLFMRPSAESK